MDKMTGAPPERLKKSERRRFLFKTVTCAWSVQVIVFRKGIGERAELWYNVAIRAEAGGQIHGISHFQFI